LGEEATVEAMVELMAVAGMASSSSSSSSRR
jgi:hypothetical protein